MGEEKSVIKQLTKVCFTDEAMKSIAERVLDLYRERRSNVDNEIEPLKQEIKTIDSKINNWIEAIGEGLLDKNILASKIKESNEKKAFLESQLLQQRRYRQIVKLMKNKLQAFWKNKNTCSSLQTKKKRNKWFRNMSIQFMFYTKMMAM